jgi:class 3 adenylate cyclase
MLSLTSDGRAAHRGYPRTGEDLDLAGLTIRFLTVLFTDIVDSTARASASGDRMWRVLLNRHHALVRAEIARHRGREVNTTGDGFVVCFEDPAQAVRCALAIAAAVRHLGLEIRAGVHAGDCCLQGDEISGITLHIGARIVALAAPGEVLVSSTVKDLVAGTGAAFAHRGAHFLKAVPHRWDVFAASLPGRAAGGASRPRPARTVDRPRRPSGYRSPSSGGRRGPAARSAAGSGRRSSRPWPPIPILRKALVIG